MLILMIPPIKNFEGQENLDKEKKSSACTRPQNKGRDFGSWLARRFGAGDAHSVIQYKKGI